MVHDELRKLTAARLAQEKPGQTLQATTLVHEAYLKLAAGDTPRNFVNHRHFLSAARAPALSSRALIGTSIFSSKALCRRKLCDVEVIPIQRINEAYERLLYRFVIDMASLRA